MHILIVLIFLVLLLFICLLFQRNKVPEGPNRFGAVAAPSVNFVDASKRFFSNYFNFSGRASRSEFWYAMLLFMAASFLIGAFNLPHAVALIWLLITIIPFLSVTARRLHDTNRSGWLQLVSWFAPVGTIVAIIWFNEPPNG